MKIIDTANKTKMYMLDNIEECMTCEDAYKILNCEIIEVVNLQNGDCFIVDERGKLKNPPLPINTVATDWWAKSFSSNNTQLQFYDDIVGDVIYIAKELREDVW